MKLSFTPPHQSTLTERGYSVSCVYRPPQIFREHQHAELQIIVPFKNARIIATWQTATGRTETTRVHDGQVAVVASHQPHELDWQVKAGMGMFWLTPEFIERATGGSFKTEISRIVENYGARDNLIRELGNALLAGWQESNLPNLYTESLANVIAVRLAERYAVGAKIIVPPARGGLTWRQIKITTDYVHGNLSREITLAELAEQIHLSPYHFARQFKTATGKSPYRFVTEIRIERAGNLLDKTDLPIIEVCFRCGFQTQSYFTTLFRRYTGTTPKVYRETK